MEKEYVTPEMEITEFEAEDVLNASDSSSYPDPESSENDLEYL